MAGQVVRSLVHAVDGAGCTECQRKLKDRQPSAHLGGHVSNDNDDHSVGFGEQKAGCLLDAKL